jgi:outer membrane protein TolC
VRVGLKVLRSGGVLEGDSSLDLCGLRDALHRGSGGGRLFIDGGSCYSSGIPVKNTLMILLSVGLVTAGCTAEHHRRSADRQVQQIVHDRQLRTLGYTPEVDVPIEMPDRPTRRAYAHIPTTPIAPPLPPAVDRADLEAPYGPLGPELRPRYDGLFDNGVFGIEAAERHAQLQLLLGPPAPGEEAVALDLLGSVDYAVQHGRTHRTRMEELYLTALNVTLERHLLSPRPFVRTGIEARGRGREADYAAAMAVTGSAGVRQRLPYGGEIVAQTLVEFVNAIHGEAAEGETASVVLSATVPLLRGAGLINLEPLIRSERRLIYSVREFEDFRRQFLLSIATQYFNLLTRQQGLNNRRLNYQSLLLLTERTEALFQAGLINLLEVQRAAQALLVAQSALIDAQEGYQSALDNFKILLGMPVEEELQIVPVELDVKIPDLDDDEVVRLAMQYRLDLQTARDQIEDARRGVQNARQGLLPDLNLNSQARVQNPAGTDFYEVDERTLSYSAGLSLDLPIDRLPERNSLRRAMIDFERSQRNYEELRERISVAARSAVRAIRSAQINLEIQRVGIELAERRLEYANELLRQGRTDARNVVEAQQSLLSAQDAFEQARAQLQIQVLQYLRETGTLRVDPSAGVLGQAMDRAGPEINGGRFGR